ncbi:MAG: DUF4783 domain-containing protein [Bacteroidales bacterium]|nr:DUF4783 domain-containing protein [Bacteroidales bacterium]
MKKMLLAVLTAFVCVFQTSAQSNVSGVSDVFLPVSKYILRGDVESLSAWMDDNVDVNIGSGSHVCSRQQAVRILSAFFSTYTPTSFNIRHQVSQDYAKTAVGLLEAGAKSFNVTIFIYYNGEGRENGFRIQMINIEPAS